MLKIGFNKRVGSKRCDCVKPDDILNLICDGRWHSIDSVVRRLNADVNKVREALDCLAKFDFVTWDEKKTKVKVSESYLSLLWSPHG